jgi:uncharacterized protein
MLPENQDLPQYLWSIQNQLVRDLAWAIGSPSLFLPTQDLPTLSSTFFRESLNHCTPLISQLDIDPSPLIGHMSKRNGRRLGFYFENLLEFWFLNDSRIKLLAKNLAVYDGKITKGAFDFIVSIQGMGTIHLEVTVKFYLGISTPEWSHWVGMNRKDRLDLKLGKILGHQLPLSRTEEGRQSLNTAGICSDIERMVIIKGILFPPIANRLMLPHGFDALQYSGIWAEESDAVSLIAENENHQGWMIRRKPNWLSPAVSLSEESVNDSIAMIERLKYLFSVPSPKPVMLSRLVGVNGLYAEDLRIVAVPNNWFSDSNVPVNTLSI